MNTFVLLSIYAPLCNLPPSTTCYKVNDITTICAKNLDESSINWRSCALKAYITSKYRYLCRLGTRFQIKVVNFLGYRLRCQLRLSSFDADESTGRFQRNSRAFRCLEKKSPVSIRLRTPGLNKVCNIYT